MSYLEASFHGTLPHHPALTSFCPLSCEQTSWLFERNASHTIVVCSELYELRLAMDSWSSCIIIPNTENAGVHNHTCSIHPFKKKSFTSRRSSLSPAFLSLFFFFFLIFIFYYLATFCSQFLLVKQVCFKLKHTYVSNYVWPISSFSNAPSLKKKRVEIKMTFYNVSFLSSIWYF